MQLLLRACIPQNPSGRIWQHLNHLGAAVALLSGAKAFCPALCLVLGIGAALGLETWERQLA